MYGYAVSAIVESGNDNWSIRTGRVLHGVLRASESTSAVVSDWRHVHDKLRGLAKRRGEHDAEEARWLRRGEEVGLWRRAGCVSALDYLERELGYGPREGRERLRIARALGSLPATEAELARGDIRYSAVRELVRVATRATEDKWLAAVRGKTLRQIEELVRGRRPGDLPDDPIDPDLERHRVVLDDISASTLALLRDVRVALDEHRAGTPGVGSARANPRDRRETARDRARPVRDRARPEHREPANPRTTREPQTRDPRGSQRDLLARVDTARPANALPRMSVPRAKHARGRREPARAARTPPTPRTRDPRGSRSRDYLRAAACSFSSTMMSATLYVGAPTFLLRSQISQIVS